MKRTRGVHVLIAWSILVGFLMVLRTTSDVLSVARASYNGPVGVGVSHQLIGFVCLVPLYAASEIAFLMSGTRAALAIDVCLLIAHLGVATLLVTSSKNASSVVAVWIAIQLLASMVFLGHSLVAGPFYFPSFKSEAVALALASIAFYGWALVYVLRLGPDQNL